MKNNSSHILVIRLSAMGDVAMTVPVLAAFFEKYPNVKITVLTRKFLAPVFEPFPNVSVFEAEVKGRHQGFLGLWRLFRELKSLNIDVVADLHNVLRSNILKSFFAFTSIPFEQIDKGRLEKKVLTALKGGELKNSLKSTHQRYVDVFSNLGFSFDLSHAKPIDVLITSNKVKELVSGVSKKKIGIAPFAAYKSKMYPLEFMEDVICELNKSKAYQIFFFGGGATEIKVLQNFDTTYKNAVNCAGLLTFQEELQLISKLDIMVAMDSGNAHLAANYGVPILTLWGVTHPYAGFSPFNFGKNEMLMADRSVYPLIPTSIYGNKFPEGYENAMTTISPAEILRNIEKILLSN
ncbi:glycosyltransferase family 9 protein [Aurantibacter sp.]|uniref:glycosyltransferase family 9 protein n=1 Tax=Aurantibacter sp. TaxID=2807103 RepID=UPI003265B3C5